MTIHLPSHREGPLCRPIRLLVITSLLLFSLALVGCTGTFRPEPESSPRNPRPSSTPSYRDVPGGRVGGASPSATGSPEREPGEREPEEPTGHDHDHPADVSAPAAVLTVAKRYIDAKENAESWHRDKPESWLADVRPLMTDRAYRELSGRYRSGGSGGWVWDASHMSGLAVRAVVTKCSVPGGPRSADGTVVRCSFTDQVIDRSGEPLPLTRIPPLWPHVGPKTAVLVMTGTGGKWLVDDDVSDAAG